MMVEGKFEAAAAIFAQLSQEAVAHGRIKPAGFLAMQAGRAYAQAGRGAEALNQARRALDIMLNAGNPVRAARAMPRAIAFLRAHGLNVQAAALEKEATQRLAKLGLTLQPGPNFGARTLPSSCPNCAGPLRSDEVEWIDAVSAECPWCGSAVKVA